MPSKDAITEMFDDISPYYDRLNHLLSFEIDRLWRRKAAHRIASLTPGHILDLATGTADLAIMLAEKIPNATIIGLDRSAKMLQIANEKTKRKKLEHQIRFITGDGEELPFIDNTFDVVSIAFGIRNYQHRENGLCEVLRVLKPEGRLIIIEFSLPENKLLKPFYQLYFKHILPAIGRIVSKNHQAYRYLPQSVYAFPRPEAFINMMLECGFENIKRKPLSFGIASMYEGQKKCCFTT